MNLLRVVAVGVFLFAGALQSQTSPPPIVRFHTNLGDIDVQLLPNSAPKAVANFLAYMNAGSYNNSIIHRSVQIPQPFVWQGGGYQLIDHALVAIPANAPITGEPSVSNKRGTIAMALTGSDINSATTQWYFNEVDNAGLDSQGFTVFGRITNEAGLAVMDSISTVPVFDETTPLGATFNQIPLLNFTTGSTVQDSSYVLVETITEIQEYPSITANGIITASNFGSYPAAAPGSIIEIYGSNLAGSTRGWVTSDFSGNNAPTSLDGVSVSIDGKPAYVSFVSPSQVNVQVPATVSNSIHDATVVLTYSGVVSGAVSLPIRPYEGALLAPPGFKVGNTQYIAAIHANTNAFVSNGNIPGIPSAPAVPGETLVLYGVGFGPVTPSSTPVAGEIAQGQTSLATAPFRIVIGNSQAIVNYAGLAPGYVGLYQFNVVVPSDAPAGDLPVTVTLGEQTLPQVLSLSVQASK